MIVCLKAFSHSNQLDDCAMGNGWEKEGICERGREGRLDLGRKVPESRTGCTVVGVRTLEGGEYLHVPLLCGAVPNL